MGSISRIVSFKYILFVILFSFIAYPIRSNIIQGEDSLIHKDKNFKAEDFIRGERLFYGLVYKDNKSINCAGCHNTGVSDTLNWNPDALEISRKYLAKSTVDLSRVLIRPSVQKMMQVHKEFQLSPEDIIMIKAYMDKMVIIGLNHNKPVITNLILFLIASILFFISFIDLIISKILKKQWINYFILFTTGIYITGILVVEAVSLGRSSHFSPLQPVKFSHAVHSGQNKTDCFYCHSFAQISKSAGFPPENVCMNCHLMVRNGKRSGAFEIAKVISAYENKKTIEWVRVHNLPDHVFFSHAQHVGAGGIMCHQCHGKVDEMDVIRQESDLSMGWCINCHRSRKIDIQNNRFYSQYRELTDKIKGSYIDSATVDMVGGIECMKCHY